MLGRISLAALVALALALAASPGAGAQDDHLWPRFAVDLGAYQISTTDKIEFAGGLNAGGLPVDVEASLGLPEDKSLLSLKLDWAFAERHSLELGAFSFSREGARSVRREFQIGDTTFPIGASLAAKLDTTSVEAAYTWWFLRHDKVGMGGTLGFVWLSLDADVSATAEIGQLGESVTRSASASTDLPVPMIGLAVKGAPWERLVLNARARFLPDITVGDYSGSAGSFTVGGEVYVWGPLALGVSFDGQYYDADVETTNWHGSLDTTSEGWRFYLRAAF